MSNSGLLFYFLPSLTRNELTRAKAKTLPFASSLSDVTKSERLWQLHTIIVDVALGPSGSSGVLLATKPANWPNAHKVGYFADAQTWKPRGSFWLGMDNEVAPGPDSLQRVTLMDGYEVELGDGSIWIAPIIRAWNDDGYAIALPKDLGFDEHEQCVALVKSDYQWAWNLACDVWDFVIQRGTVPLEQFTRWAIECLSLNYRIGIHEASVLGLFDTATAREVLHASVDWVRVEAYFEAEAEKKSQVIPEV